MQYKRQKMETLLTAERHGTGSAGESPSGIAKGKREVPPGKICKECGIWKLLLDFYKTGTGYGYTEECQICRDLYYEDQGKCGEEPSLEQWEDLAGKAHAKCKICGYTGCSAALDYHHRDPKEKSFTISQWIRQNSFNNQNKRIFLTELDKCDILCCRCHRELHWYQNHSKEEN